MGVITGCSTVHYLITLFHFILSGTDSSDKVPKAAIIALIDYSKGFNRISHNKLIIRLSDWGVPGWLLRILCSYMTERTMTVRYKGATSTPHPLSGKHSRVVYLTLRILHFGVLPFPEVQTKRNLRYLSTVPY